MGAGLWVFLAIGISVMRSAQGQMDVNTGIGKTVGLAFLGAL
jgi:hypothetical protein